MAKKLIGFLLGASALVFLFQNCSDFDSQDLQTISQSVNGNENGNGIIDDGLEDDDSSSSGNTDTSPGNGGGVGVVPNPIPNPEPLPMPLPPVPDEMEPPVDNRPWEAWRRIDCSQFPSNGKIEGSSYNNTYFEGCTLRNASSDAVFIKNVDNFAIVGFDISGANREGIKLSSSSGATSDNIYIVENRVTNVEGDGIACPQRHRDGVIHTNVRIWNNTVIGSGLSNEGKKRHGIYNQCQDAEVIGNYVEDNRNGNGITMRSSGIVRGNRVRMLSNGVYPAPYGINYYSDHHVGPSDTLIIEDNVIDYNSFVGNGQQQAIRLTDPTSSSYHDSGADGRVHNFIIRNNAIASTDGDRIQVANYWRDASGFSVTEQGNRVFNSYSDVPADWTTGN